MAKQNSMDIIQIRYGVDLSNPPDLDASPDERVLFEKKKAQVKTCSLRAFIYPEKYPDEAPKSFTKNEQKIQEALRFLYEQNEKDPPLFEKFPDWRQSLVIDCTTATSKGNFLAAFNPDENKINFGKGTNKLTFVGILAHELKHAEHCTKELYDIGLQKTNVDNLGIQQCRFLDEGIAYPFGNYVQMMYFLKDGPLPIKELGQKMAENADFGTPVVIKRMLEYIRTKPKPGFWDKILGRTPQRNYKDLERELIPLMLDSLYQSSYKVEYDGLTPVGQSNKGLKEIPEGFALDKSYARRLLAGKLQEVPQKNILTMVQYMLEKKDKAKVLAAILAQENEDGSGILGKGQYDDLLWQVNAEKDTEGLKSLLKKKDKNGVSWVSNECKINLLKYMLRYEPIENTTAFFSELQKESPAVFDTTEVTEILQNDKFWTPIRSRTQTEFDSQKQLERILPEQGHENEQKVDSSIKKKVKLVCALMADKKNLAQWPKTLLCQSIKFGYTEIAKHMLNLHSKNGTLLLRPDAIHDYFNEVLKMDGSWNEHLTESEQGCLQKRSTQMISIFLDLKDQDGQPIISQDDLQNLSKQIDPKTHPVLIKALEQYKKEHPKDKRFANFSTLMPKLSKCAEEGKNVAQEDTSKGSLSVGQRATLKNRHPQH